LVTHIDTGGPHLISTHTVNNVRENYRYASALTMLEKNDGERGSYLDIAAWIETNAAAPKKDMAELWRRIIFTIAIGNVDDHFRNHGFLRCADGTGWELSPVFDINPTPGLQMKQLSTAIDDTTVDANFDIALDVVEFYGLSRAAGKGIISEVGEIIAGWENYAHASGLSSKERGTIGPALELGAMNALRVSANP
jgi:serine/threonine-protein kinase HipA